MNNTNNFDTITDDNFDTIVLCIADRVMSLPGQSMGRSFDDLIQQSRGILLGEQMDRRDWKKDAGPVDIQGLAQMVQIWLKAMDYVATVL